MSVNDTDISPSLVTSNCDDDTQLNHIEVFHKSP